MLKLVMAAMATLTLALAATPASAKDKAPDPPKAPFTYVATIDCGRGPVVVGSYDDVWADLEDVKTGRLYSPVEWHVAVGDQRIDLVKGVRERHAVTCSYDDGVASGTVVVARDHHHRDR